MFGCFFIHYGTVYTVIMNYGSEDPYPDSSGISRSLSYHFTKDSKKFQKKLDILPLPILMINLPYRYYRTYLKNILFQWPQKCPGRIRIRNSRLLIRGSVFVRNIYGSGTMTDPLSFSSLRAVNDIAELLYQTVTLLK
jgi:hypothetical protein